MTVGLGGGEVCAVYLPLGPDTKRNGGIRGILYICFGPDAKSGYVGGGGGGGGGGGVGQYLLAIYVSGGQFLL